MRRRLALALCGIARTMLPARQRPWADAMIAELPHAENDATALAYAGGCLIGALRERLRDDATQLVAGLWAIALVTGYCAVSQIACAARGIGVLMGARDNMLQALLANGASPAMIAGYQAARPTVIICFIILGGAQLAAAWFLSAQQLHRFAVTWCVALVAASVAVIIQLSIVPGADGVPSEFHALLLQAVALPALLFWCHFRQGRSGRTG